MEALTAVLQSDEYEDDGSVRVAQVCWPDDGCILLLDVRAGGSRESRRAFEVRCAEVRSSRVIGQVCEDAALYEEHPLLLPYREPQVRLSFRGRPAEPRLLVADLWNCHQALLAEWVSFMAFLSPQMPLQELLAAGSGILAEGPRSVLEAYAEILAGHGLESSLLAERPSVRWTATGWQPERADLQVFVAGESYVVGAGFDVREVTLGHRDRVT